MGPPTACSGSAGCGSRNSGPATSASAVGQVAPPRPGDTLRRAAIRVLRTADPWLKASYGDIAAQLWNTGDICRVSVRDDPSTRPPAESDEAGTSAGGGCSAKLLEGEGIGDGERSGGTAAEGCELDEVPQRPARDGRVAVVAPGDMPRRGKAGSLRSRQALLHSLVHIESWAIDLSWDIIARFCNEPEQAPLPRAFFDDFVRVATDEGRHFRLLALRLRELGAEYGDFPTHDGLWESATRTSHDLMARLAVEHCVHEARGLDVVPGTIERFRAAGDAATAALLEDVVYPEEVTHCAAGVRWFTYLARCRLGLNPAHPLPPEHCSLAQCQPEELEEKKQLRQQQEGAICSRVCDELGEEVPNCSKEAEQQQPQQNGGGLEPSSSVPGWHLDDINNNGRSKSLGESDVLAADPFRAHPLVVQHFHDMVRQHFRGNLKPPFNKAARRRAGFLEEWYLPLATDRLAG